MDLDECFRKGLIKRTKRNRGLARSLLEMANIKERTVKTAQLDELNISAYISLAYDALRQVLEAICVLNGYKVLSHACVGELLNELLEDFNYKAFDRLRYVRNNINYYGIKVDFEQGKEIIRKTFRMKEELVRKYLSELQNF